MQHHLKQFEDVFSSDTEKNRAKLRIENLSAVGMSLDEYTKLFHDFLTDFYLSLFENSVKLSWLRRRFKWYGFKTIIPMAKNSPGLSIAFVKFLRRNVGNDIQILTRGNFFTKLELYFDDFFPGFDESNPWENPDYYKFPFKNISIDFLMVVYQLDDRMELLKIADEGKMSYAIFVDYVINHIFSENETLKRNRYEVQYGIGKHYPFYIKDRDKIRKRK